MHGEISALLDLTDSEAGENPHRLVLYSTAEPCPMCSGAIVWSGIPSVVFGTTIGTLKRLGLPQIDLSCEEVASRALFDGFEVVRGVLEDECDALFEEAARRMRG